MTPGLQHPNIEIEFQDTSTIEHTVNPSIGIAAEQIANGLTAVRGVGAVAINRHIVSTEDYQSWQTVGAFTLLALTDMEGKLARWGRKVQGKDENVSRPVQSYIDHLTDKGLVDGTMAAIASREQSNGNTAYASAVAVSAGITIARDVATTADRVVADVQGIDTRAQESGKRKAIKQYLAVGFALSPLAKSTFGKTVATLGLGHTVHESVKSGWSLHQHFSNQRKSQQ